MAFYRIDGPRRIRKIAVDSSTVLAVGDLVKTDGNDQEVTAATSNAAILGIAMEASASGSTAAIDIDILAPGEAIKGTVETGTPTLGLWDKADLNSQDGVTLTNSNDDFYFQYDGDFNGTTYSVSLYPTHLEVSQGT